MEIKAGASKKIITPKYPVYLAGLAGNRLSKGIHDELYARCAIVEENNKKYVFISCDLIGLFRDEIEKIIDKISKNKGIEKDNVLIACTHLHSGPDTLGLWGEEWGKSGISQEYMDFLKEKIFECTKETEKNLKPCKIKFSSAYIEGVAKNYRGDKIDDEISIIKIDAEDGKCIATLVNYGCHPEVLWSENLLITSDYVGYLNDYIENEFSGISLFFNGALGGMVVPDVKENTFEEAKRIGEKIAKKVITAEFENAKFENGILWKKEVFDVPLKNPFLQTEDILKMVERKIYDGKIRTEVNYIKFFNSEIITVPGEILPKLGMKLKNKLKSKYKFIISLANDELGYIIPEEDFFLEKFNYERTRSVGPEIGTLIEKKIEKLIST
jgi:hypothetical protein